MNHELRQEDRYNVTVAASFRSGTEECRPVRVVNLSARGCRFVAREGRLATGTSVTLGFGRVDAIDARIRWRLGRSHGVRFEQPLKPTELDHIRLFLSEEPALFAERELVSA